VAADPNSNSSQARANIFISYSRHDMAFADRLEAGLKARGFAPQIDRTDIYAFEDWWKRIQALIIQADTIVFILSPDSIASDICQKEVAFAASLNKRFAPIVCRPLNAAAVPEQLSRLNFVYFDNEALFEENMDKLRDALSTNIEWIRKHTELGEVAQRWSEAGRANQSGLLLRSPLLEEAERWVASRPSGAPLPTEATQAFIAQSRRAATRRREVLTASLAAGFVLAVGLAGLATWQRGIAVQNEKLAVANEKKANDQRIENLKGESRLVSVAAQQLVDENQPALAQAIALEGLPKEPGDRPIVDEAVKALKRAIRADRSLVTLALKGDEFLSIAFMPDGRSLVTGTSTGKLIVWDLQAYQPKLQIETNNDHGLLHFDISPDGRTVLAASDNHPGIWDLADGRLRVQIPAVARGFARKGQFSPDGRRFAIGYNDNHAEIWDVAAGKVLYRLDGPNDFDAAYRRRTSKFLNNGTGLDDVMEENNWKMFGGMSEVLFSPNGKILAIAGQGDAEAALRLFDVSTGKLIATLPSENLVASLSYQKMSFSPDGGMLALASRDNIVRVWNVSEKKQLFTLAHTAESHALAFDPTGAFLFVGYADGSVRIWSMEDGQAIATFTAHHDRITSIAFNSSGDMFAMSSNDRNISLWRNTLEKDACGPKDRALFCDTHLPLAAVLRGHTDNVQSVVFSPDGKIVASIGADSTLRLWRTETPGVLALESSPKEKTVSQDDDCNALEAKRKEPSADSQENLPKNMPEAELRKMAENYGLGEEAKTLKVNALRIKLAATLNGLIAEQEKLLQTTCEFRKLMGSLAESHGRSAHTLERLAAQLGNSAEPSSGTDEVHKITFSRDETHLLASEDGNSFTLWDLITAQPQCQIPGSQFSIANDRITVYDESFGGKPAICPEAEDHSYLGLPYTLWVMSPSGTRAVANEAKEPKATFLIDMEKKTQVAPLSFDGRGIQAVQFSSDGATVIGSLKGDQAQKIPDGGQYAVWNAITGVLYGVSAPDKRERNLLAMASNGHQFVLATSGEPTLTYYFVDDQKHLTFREIKGPQRAISSVAISSDGMIIAAALIDGSITLLSSSDSKLIATLPGGNYSIRHLTFSPDARLLAGADANTSIWLWDLDSKTPILISSIRSKPTAIKFSDSGQRLAFKTERGELGVIVVELDLGLEKPEDIIDWARASLSATLSDVDRQRFLLNKNQERDENLLRIVEAAVPVAPSTPEQDVATLREEARRRAILEGVAGSWRAFAYSLSANGGKAANAAFQLGLDIGQDQGDETNRELAFFYLQVGQRLAIASPVGTVDDGLRESAIQRLKILPRQIEPHELINLYRLSRSWQGPPRLQ